MLKLPSISSSLSSFCLFSFFFYPILFFSQVVRWRMALGSHWLLQVTWRNTQLMICLWNLIHCLGRLWCLSPNTFCCYHVNYGKYYINSSFTRHRPVQRHDIDLNYLLSCVFFFFSYPSHFHLIVSRGVSGKIKLKRIPTHSNPHTHTRTYKSA